MDGSSADGGFLTAATRLYRMLGTSKLLLQRCFLQVMGVVPTGMLSKADATSMAAYCI